MAPPRMELHLKHDAAQLWDAYQASNSAVKQRRLQFLAFMAEGKTREESMRLVHYSLLSALKCIKKYNESGIDGLKDGREDNKGAPTLLSKDQFEKLIKAIKEEYDEGFIWDGKKVQSWVKEQFDLEIYLSRSY